MQRSIYFRLDLDLRDDSDVAWPLVAVAMTAWLKEHMKLLKQDDGPRAPLTPIEFGDGRKVTAVFATPEMCGDLSPPSTIFDVLAAKMAAAKRTP